MASARVQRWGLTLGAYNYSIKYKAGTKMGNADGISRLPLPETPAQVPVPGETVMLIESLQTSPVNAQKIKTWTSQDPTLSRVRQLILQGWPTVEDKALAPYNNRREELSVQDGCILWGNRIVVPPAGRKAIVEMLHEGHPGICRMKSRARSAIWWPGMDSQLEEKVKSCYLCQATQNSPPKAPLHPWEWPTRPWSRLHIDFAGPLHGKMFLLVVDANSKWMEVVICNSATSATTIEKLRTIFATHGLPDMIVSDNGTCFTSQEFQEFVVKNGIKHVRTTPYHPSSNGQVERAVKIFKEGLKKLTQGTLETQIARFLFQYRITPHTTTGVSPAELLMGRQLRSHLSLLNPDIAARVLSKQQAQKDTHDRKAKERKFTVGDKVWVREFPGGSSWLRGTLKAARGPLSFLVQLHGGRVARYHVDHIRPCTVTTDTCTSTSEVQDEEHDGSDLPAPSPEHSESSKAEDTPPSNSPLRRSTRTRQPPDYYNPALNYSS